MVYAARRFRRPASGGSIAGTGPRRVRPVAVAVQVEHNPTAHSCLFRLEHKSDAVISSIFRRKAKRGLLACLIESTRGTEDGESLGNILWMEFEGLSDRAQWAYGPVVLFGAFGLPIPQSVMERA